MLEPTCARDRVPKAAVDAMIRESGAPKHDDGHTDCYYAGLLLAALPHLITDEMVERTALALREREQGATSWKSMAHTALLAALGVADGDEGQGGEQHG